MKPKKSKKQKIILRTVIGFHILNFILVLGFIIYLFLWIRAR